MADRMERLSRRTAGRMNRRTFLGRAAGVATAVVAGTAMPLVLPAQRASALGRCPAGFCIVGKRNIPGSCWFECSGRCCGTKVTQICDCCSGIACNPRHFCDGPSCRFVGESFARCTTMSC